MKRTKILKGSIMKEKKMILRNIISKKRTKKNITTNSTTGFREYKIIATINVIMSWHKKKQLLHDKYKEKLSMMKKLRCGTIYFSKVALERARKYCIKRCSYPTGISINSFQGQLMTSRKQVTSLSNAIATPALFSLDCRTTPNVLLLEENNLGSCFYHRYTKVKVCQERSEFFGGV